MIRYIDSQLLDLSKAVDYKKEIDKEIATYSIRMKFDPKDTDAIMREYGVETAMMTSGRSVPVPKYPKGGYIGMDFGVDSHGDILATRDLYKNPLPTYNEIKKAIDNLNNKKQNGKAINLPRKNPAVKKGHGFTGRTITSRTGPTTITVGYIGD